MLLRGQASSEPFPSSLIHCYNPNLAPDNTRHCEDMTKRCVRRHRSFQGTLLDPCISEQVVPLEPTQGGLFSVRKTLDGVARRSKEKSWSNFSAFFSTPIKRDGLQLRITGYSSMMEPLASTSWDGRRHESPVLPLPVPWSPPKTIRWRNKGDEDVQHSLFLSLLSSTVESTASYFLKPFRKFPHLWP